VPVVSVIMPARNAAATIAQSLQSVLDQDCLAEIIVIDDGSTDGTADVAIRLNDTRIKVVQGPCTGISAALNVGFQAATGDFVARCDADDTFLPARLETQVKWLLANPGYGAISGGFISMDATGNRLGDLACQGTGRDVSALLRDGTTVSHLGTWLIRRALIDAIGGARAWFETAEDLDLQVRLAFQGDVWHEPVPVYGYRLHDASITHRRPNAQLAYFDTAVRLFAEQRRKTGTDALERGSPPAIPGFSTLAQDTKTLSGQMTGQMTGHLTAQAWRNFRVGHKRAALQAMFKALRLSPSSAALWRGTLAMVFKMVFRRS
jgi:glycosyltransferase involved in cell wall biosynthesis